MARKSNNAGEMSFLEHLEELRWHIVRSAIAIVVCAVVAFIFSRFIFDYILLAPKNPDFITYQVLCRMSALINMEILCLDSELFSIQNIQMAGQFSTDIMVSLIAGLIVAFPFIAWEMWRFISPALYEKERKYARGSVFWVSVLFILGVLFGYYVIVPMAVHFLGGYHTSDQIHNIIDLNSYFSTVSYTTLATGVIFELPMLMIFLAKVGFITPEFMKKYRKHAYILLLVLAAVITPPDVFSQILVVLPLGILYEASILLTRRATRKRQEAMDEEEKKNS